MKIRYAKRRQYAHYLEVLGYGAELSKEVRAWFDAAPVGREFGSPDFERLLATATDAHSIPHQEESARSD